LASSGKGLELGLCPLVVDKSIAGIAEHRGELRPRIRRAHVDDTDCLDPRPWRLGIDQVRDLAGLDTAPELLFRRLLACHAREHGPAAGHKCLANLVQGTVCKILGQEDIKPHKVRYYLEQRDAEFEQKMAEVLCVYREVKVLKKAAAKSHKPGKPVAIVSYDEKPGIQAIATTAPDLPPRPGLHATFARDHEYKRHGTLSLLAGINQSICSPAKFMPWSETATAAENLSNSSSCSILPIRPAPRSN
jgi:hypothetical protein